MRSIYLILLLQAVIFSCSLAAHITTEQCLSNCTQTSAAPCCDCCTTGQTCNGNIIYRTCCNADESFCGCISNRAFCLGRVGSSLPAGVNTFGTCYDPSEFSCSYQPTPNYWILCPTGSKSCFGSDAGTSSNVLPICCPSTHTCSYNQSSFTLGCTPPASSSTCGSITCGGSDQCCNGQCYNPSSYSCQENEQGQSVLCGANQQACGDACYNPSEYCCQSTGLMQISQCGGSSTGTPSTTTTGGGPSTCQCVIATDQCCNGQCYDPSAYSCPQNELGQRILCPSNSGACGGACFSESEYCCSSSGLKPISECGGSGSSTSGSGTSGSTTPLLCGTAQCHISTDQCCADVNTGSRCYNPQTHTCTTNQQGQRVLCATNERSCNNACYDASRYCCANGALQQREFCPTGAN